ncbi:MAG: DUF5660 family protein [Patescibacteria group bacterium]
MWGAMTPLKSTHKPKTKVEQYASDNPLEVFKGIMGGVAQSGADLAKDFTNLNKLVYTGYEETGGKRKKVTGDLFEGEEVDLRQLRKIAQLKNQTGEQEKQDRMLDIDPGYDYKSEILHREKRSIQRLSQETENNIQQILVELKKLVSTTRELKTQFKEVAVEKVVNPGKYHESFFEWLLSSVRDALKKVEDSGAWLSAVKSKNAKRGYWDLANEKVGGTSFSLSSERVVATQTG